MEYSMLFTADLCGCGVLGFVSSSSCSWWERQRQQRVLRLTNRACVSASRDMAAVVAPSKKTLAKQQKTPVRRAVHSESPRTLAAASVHSTKKAAIGVPAAASPKNLGRPMAGRVQKASAIAAAAAAAAAVADDEAHAVTVHRRHRPGRRALIEIRLYRGMSNKMLPQHTCYLLRRLSFERLVREIAQDLRDTDTHFAAGALLALQSAAESFLSSILEKTNEVAIMSGRTGIVANDLRAAVRWCAPDLACQSPTQLAMDKWLPLVSISKKARAATE